MTEESDQTQMESNSRSVRSIAGPCATVFISSFCIMVLELVAGRVIARYLGSSLYTWTAVIGVVLAGITLGNYTGGRIADLFPSRRSLAVLFTVTSVSCVLTVVLNNLAGEWTWLWQFSWPQRVFLHVCMVFLLPSVLLGTISPVVAKMALDQGLATGRTVGNIYAWGAAGSIAGTFAAGYYLIATMGTTTIIWTISAVILIMALIYWTRFKTAVKDFARKAESNQAHIISNSRSIAGPCATVFIAGFFVMVLELVAGRVIARYLGSSLYTWTSVIGVVLAGITLGNYAGGRIADLFPARKSLAVLFTVTSVSCVLTVVLNNLAGEWTWLWQFSWPLRTFFHVCLVFLIPSVLLGTINPVVAKMALDHGLATGRTVGDIYAWGAAGSIAGTFAAGYYLIAALGTATIIWAVSAALLVMALIYWARFKVVYLWMLLFLAFVSMGIAPWPWAQNAGSRLALRVQAKPDVIYEDETQYCYITVKRISQYPDIRTFTQDKLVHSCVNMNDITDLQYPYEIIYDALTRRFSRGKDKLSTLSIGGGGYVFPRYIEKTWPGSRVDVVEIDPGVTEAAMRAFGLQHNTSIRTISLDGRNYVDELLKQRIAGAEKIYYDFIYEDAFNDYSVPFQVTTREFNEKISRLLADDGVYMINLTDMFDSGQFLGAIVNTMNLTFSDIYVISEKNVATSIRDTFVIVAANRPLDLENLGAEYKNNLNLWVLDGSDMEYLRQKSRGLVLTDNYAPVENLLAPVVRKNVQDALSKKKELQARNAAEQMQALAWQAKVLEALEKVEEMILLDPSMSVRAYIVLGNILEAKGKVPEAAEVYQKGLLFHTQKKPDTNVADIYLNYSSALNKLNQKIEAAALLVLAEQSYLNQLRKKPGSADAHFHLGDIARQRGNLNEAIKHFMQAVESSPASPDYHLNLIEALKSDRRFEDAIKATQKAIQVMAGIGQKAAVSQLQQYLGTLSSQKDQT